MTLLLETPRLTLSPYTEDDADALMLNAGSPEVARMMSSIPVPMTRAAAMARIAERQCDENRFTFAIRDRQTGEAIGEIGSGRMDADTPPQLGYFLCPGFWGRGLASEAVDAALGHAFRTLRWTQIDAETFDDNPASVRILTRAGFVRVGPSNCISIARPDTDVTTLYRLTKIAWGVPVLQTARLTLRPPVVADAERVGALLGDRDVAWMLNSVPHPYSVEDAREWLSGALGQPEDIACAIDDGTGLIGVASLTDVAPGVRRLGFWLGQPYWGRGLMSEAVNALVSWGFHDAGLDRIESSAFMDNIASRRIHAKLGFAEGEAGALHSPARNGSAPSITFSLDRQDWTPTS